MEFIQIDIWTEFPYGELIEDIDVTTCDDRTRRVCHFRRGLYKLEQVPDIYL